ncbi:hypothetical protein Salat_1850800 [Sesamum alatum]|uniref:Uncharacterized protein n=1 Tax=Sesamum alatum TaxID=300844 RepID=A0AAE1Y412_9LAMI|nr:hypothetical protein Salat_1850800 [Sesamum alatum]
MHRSKSIVNCKGQGEKKGVKDRLSHLTNAMKSLSPPFLNNDPVVFPSSSIIKFEAMALFSKSNLFLAHHNSQQVQRVWAKPSRSGFPRMPLSQASESSCSQEMLCQG